MQLEEFRRGTGYTAVAHSSFEGSNPCALLLSNGRLYDLHYKCFGNGMPPDQGCTRAVKTEPVSQVLTACVMKRALSTQTQEQLDANNGESAASVFAALVRRAASKAGTTIPLHRVFHVSRTSKSVRGSVRVLAAEAGKLLTSSGKYGVFF